MKQFKDTLFEKALQAGFTDAEMFFMRSNKFVVSIFNSEINKYQITDYSGVSFRGTYNGTMCYSYSEKVDLDEIDNLIKSAIENSLIIEDPEKEELYKGDTDYDNINVYNEHSTKIDVSKKIEDAFLMEKTAKEADSRVTTVNNCSVITGESHTFISNTKGLELSKKNNSVVAYVSVIVKEDEQTKTFTDFYISNDYNGFNPIEVAKSTVANAISQLGAKSIKSGKYKTVIENKTFIEILGSFLSIFFAESVQKGFSLLASKLGEKIASDCITIKDDPIKENCLASTSFDSEGVKTYNKTIVQNGVLKTYLYNLKSAKKDNVKSTGNGFKDSFKSYVTTGVTNFYVENGNKSFNTILEEVQDGIFITDVAGLHSGINIISGDFSLLASGYKITNGKKSDPIDQITIAGNFFEMLKNIVDISDDLYFLGGAEAYIGSPSIYISSLDVSGL